LPEKANQPLDVLRSQEELLPNKLHPDESADLASLTDIWEAERRFFAGQSSIARTRAEDFDTPVSR